MDMESLNYIKSLIDDLRSEWEYQVGETDENRTFKEWLLTLVRGE